MSCTLLYVTDTPLKTPDPVATRTAIPAEYENHEAFVPVLSPQPATFATSLPVMEIPAWLADPATSTRMPSCCARVEELFCTFSPLMVQ